MTIQNPSKIKKQKTILTALLLSILTSSLSYGMEGGGQSSNSSGLSIKHQGTDISRVPDVEVSEKTDLSDIL